jgi:signal-transduction protein with cAMP-binding, CBS, and nucleotidyltransferase domain
MMSVKQVISKVLLKIDGKSTIGEAAKVMKRERVGSILVTQGNQINGIITETDIIQKLVAVNLDPGRTLVEMIMSSPLLTIEADCSVLEANDLMDRKHVRHLGVTDQGKVVGMISVRDLLHPLYLEEDV